MSKLTIVRATDLGLGGFFVKRETGVNLSGDTAWDDVQDLLSELDELREK
jgi:hypothetical protein